MLFNKNSKLSNEKVVYQTRPNMFLYCKSAIFAFILMILILSFASVAIRYVGNMQFYLVDYLNFALSKYLAIAIFTVIFILIIYIVYKLVSWYSIEYTLTNQRIIVKKGILYTKKNYIYYNSIQDINTSQSLLGRILSVGTISLFSAYDNNQIELKKISNPNKIEEIISSQLNNLRSNYGGALYRDYGYEGHNSSYRDDYQNEYYDSYDDNPINYENERDYYEDSYDDLDYNINKVINPDYQDINSDINYHTNENHHQNSLKYQGMNDLESRDYIYSNRFNKAHHRKDDLDNHKHDVDYSKMKNESYSPKDIDFTNEYFNRDNPKFKQEKNFDKKDDDLSSEDPIERHFKKFRK